MNDFNVNYLCLYINPHRPCCFPEIKVGAKAKHCKIYSFRKTNEEAI
jgi:hypothetical protein